MDKTLGIRFVYEGASTQISFSLRGFTIHKMPASALRAFEFSCCRLLKSFSGAFVCLLFWHGLILSADGS